MSQTDLTVKQLKNRWWGVLVYHRQKNSRRRIPIEIRWISWKEDLGRDYEALDSCFAFCGGRRLRRTTTRQRVAVRCSKARNRCRRDFFLNQKILKVYADGMKNISD
jgi:ribosomal protein L28